MNTRTRVLIAFVVGSTVGLVAGCQTYDFEPVEPLALAKTTQKKKVISLKAKPNMMLLVDRSGSMHEPIDRNQTVGGTQVCNQTGTSQCGAGFTNCDSRCTTRWRAMETAMNAYLTGPAATVARYGLGMFPNNNQCAPGSIVQNFDIVQSNDVDQELRDQAARINQYLQALPETQVVGGTPTAPSLAVVSNSAALNTEEREDFILLLTDGLPNCNGSLNNQQCAYCVDTNAPGPCGTTLNCMDDAATVNMITTLQGRGIRTVVIGFGINTTTSGAGTALNNMATAGGMARNCLKDDGARDESLCGTEACDATTNLCATRFYKASDAAQLTAALIRISTLIDGDPCEFVLNAVPSDPNLISVTVNGATVAQSPTTWAVTGNKLTFVESGTVCPQIRSATEANPVDVEIGIIETL